MDKQVHLSTTIQGAVLQFLLLVVVVFKLDISESEVTALVTSVFSLVFLIWTVIGRIKANKNLKLGAFKL